MSRRPHGPELEALCHALDSSYDSGALGLPPQPAHLIDHEARDEGIRRQQWMTQAEIEIEQELLETDKSPIQADTPDSETL